VRTGSFISVVAFGSFCVLIFFNTSLCSRCSLAQWSRLRERFISVTKAKRGRVSPLLSSSYSSSSSPLHLVSPGDDDEGVDYSTFCEIVAGAGLASLAQPHVFKVFDNDDNGYVDYKEFMIAVTGFTKLDSSDTGDGGGERGSVLGIAKLYFQIFDTDGSGTISMEELHHVMASLLTHDASHSPNPAPWAASESSATSGVIEESKQTGGRLATADDDDGGMG
jgi:Ca2+-binding EF-hand superfamily protein